MEAKLPLNFFCLGAQKAGTSGLFEILNQHPSVFLPKEKEAHFFDWEDEFKKGNEWYLQSYFNKLSAEKYAGSFSPSYLYHEKVAERISKELKSPEQVKFLVLLRNPVDRAFSHFQMIKNLGFETSTFEEAIKREKERITQSERALFHYSYITRGLYSFQIKRYFKFFEPKQFLFLRFEDLFQDKAEETLKRIETFLGIENQKYHWEIEKNEFAKKSIQVDRIGKKLKRGGEKMKIPFLSALGKKISKLSVQKSEKPRLTLAEKKSYFELFFAEDAKELKALTGIDFYKQWKSNYEQL